MSFAHSSPQLDGGRSQVPQPQLQGVGQVKDYSYPQLRTVKTLLVLGRDLCPAVYRDKLLLSHWHSCNFLRNSIVVNVNTGTQQCVFKQ